MVFLKKAEVKLALKILDKKKMKNKKHEDVSSLNVTENLICSKLSLKINKLHDLTDNMVRHLQTAVLFFSKRKA